MKSCWWLGTIPILMWAGSPQASSAPVVLELFTSQSCSSCPSADALLKRTAQSDPSVLALSYHVDYWDHLSWKDTYSSSASTQRQQDYAAIEGTKQVFTPQLIVNGTVSMVGSDNAALASALAKAKATPLPLKIILTLQGSNLMVSIVPNATIHETVQLLEVRFDPMAATAVHSGENGGRTLESINNVIDIKLLGSWHPGTPIPSISAPNHGGVALLAQTHGMGHILGNASYITP